MERPGDLKIAEKIARGSALVIKDYIDEMRRQGRISGELSVVVKNGSKERRMPYRSTA
jgi:hypothetical protein